MRKRDVFNITSIFLTKIPMEMYVLFIFILNKRRITTVKNTSVASDAFSFEN